MAMVGGRSPGGGWELIPGFVVGRRTPPALVHGRAHQRSSSARIGAMAIHADLSGLEHYVVGEIFRSALWACDRPAFRFLCRDSMSSPASWATSARMEARANNTKLAQLT
jgi:hypothetical protein